MPNLDMNMDVYTFLNLDLQEQLLFVMTLKEKASLSGLSNYEPGPAYERYYKLCRKIDLLEELIDLGCQDAIYYSEFHDKWIIRKEFK